MKPSAPTIILTGGGSGGHITPLLSLARELKAQSPNCQIVYIGHKGDNFDTFRESGHDFDFMAFIKAGKLRRYYGKPFGGLLYPRTLALNLMDIARFPGSVMAARRLLKKFQPNVVFSKGGFVAVPVGLAAKFSNIPIITHDSDSMPGLANRVVGRWAKVHATGLPADYYPYKKRSTVQVGVPIDKRIKKVTPKIQAAVKAKLKLPKDSTVLLVSGGGNGSKRLNDLTLAIAPELLESYLSLFVIHITGPLHEAQIQAAYKNLPKAVQGRVVAVGYSQDFHAYCAAADLVITRAGATTLAELAAAGKACIVIPAPFLSGGHQLKNTQQLEAGDAAVILPNEVEPDELMVTIRSLLSNDGRRFELARNLFGLAVTDASARLAKLILETATTKQT
ncbi:UDP-N-acetylglucosamine--N-acetylmuramyl-(pentapeptide) pyrophosphoryl-undecaprenol N-acetylglucosamine transferase [Candidatus Saccharibacteria bacterium]|nr:UDP-N-acetylglucosamine--N-acetylmuramyl-(pentapeptide) pyrophosphoryl-undecaprenol N-acetylglucosamine transferase [Candidatus Saccharibacteria bacterium]